MRRGDHALAKVGLGKGLVEHLRVLPSLERPLLPVLPQGPAPRLAYRMIRERYERGLPVLADALGCDTGQAARMAWRAGVAPSRLRLDEEAFVTLATSPSEPHTVIARRLGVTRWTVASWRRHCRSPPQTSRGN